MQHLVVHFSLLTTEAFGICHSDRAWFSMRACHRGCIETLDWRKSPPRHRDARRIAPLRRPLIRMALLHHDMNWHVDLQRVCTAVVFTTWKRSREEDDDGLGTMGRLDGFPRVCIRPSTAERARHLSDRGTRADLPSPDFSTITRTSRDNRRALPSQKAQNIRQLMETPPRALPGWGASEMRARGTYYRIHSTTRSCPASSPRLLRIHGRPKIQIRRCRTTIPRRRRPRRPTDSRNSRRWVVGTRPMGSAGGSMSSGRAAVRGAFRGRGARAWGCRSGWRRGTSVLQRRCRMVAGLISAASLWGTWCRVRWVLGGWTGGGMMGWMDDSSR